MPTPFECQRCIARIAYTSRLAQSYRLLRRTGTVPVRRLFHATTALLGQSTHGEGPESSQSLHQNEGVRNGGSSASSDSHASLHLNSSRDHSNVTSEDSIFRKVTWNASAGSQPLHSQKKSQGQRNVKSDGAALPSHTFTKHEPPKNGSFRKYVPNGASQDAPTVSKPVRLPRARVRRITQIPGKRGRPKKKKVTNARLLKAKILARRDRFLPIKNDLQNLLGISSSEARFARNQLERMFRANLDTDEAARQLDQYLHWKKSFSTALRNAVALSSVEFTIPSVSETRPDEPTSMKSAWQRLDQRQREQRWPQMVLSAVETEPHNLPTFIQSTFDPSWCPSYVVEDMLYLLLRRIQLMSPEQANATQDDHAVSGIVVLAIFILKKIPADYLSLEQTFVLFIMHRLPHSELAPFYELVKSIGQELHPNTMLQFASRFAKSYDMKLQAVELIRALKAIPQFDINAAPPASVCTSLLNIHEDEPFPDDKAAPDVLFQFLLESGFSPNLLHLSALMHNFCIRGRLDVAWGIFGHMVQHGLEPDRHVYSMLFNGSKRVCDTAVTEKICRIIEARSAWSEVLVNDFLDLLYQDNEKQMETRRRQRKKMNSGWRPMLQLYAKFYNLEPLQKLMTFPVTDTLHSWSVRTQYSTPATQLAASLNPLPPEHRMKPDSIALGTMLQGFMRSVLQPKRVVLCYRRFINLMDDHERVALDLLANHGTLPLDIFLRALMQFKQTVRYAVEQLRTMIVESDWEKKRWGRNLWHPRPSVYTWTVILNGFKNHADARSCISLFNLMRSEGMVRPNLPTWNILIHVFARTYNVKGAVEAVAALERAGLQPNERTFRAFGHFPRRLREEAIRKLKAMRQGKIPIPNPFIAEFRRPGTPTYDFDYTFVSRDRTVPIPTTLRQLAEEQEKWNIKKVMRSSEKLRKRARRRGVYRRY